MVITSPLLLVVSPRPDGKLRRGGGGGGDLDVFSVRYRGTVNSPDQSIKSINEPIHLSNDQSNHKTI